MPDAFDVAWKALQKPVQKVLRKTDAAAVITVLMRYAAHLQMEAMHREGYSQEQAKRFFQGLAETCFDQQVRDGSWPR